jgi:hypothetical protein
MWQVSESEFKKKGAVQERMVKKNGEEFLKEKVSWEFFY